DRVEIRSCFAAPQREARRSVSSARCDSRLLTASSSALPVGARLNAIGGRGLFDRPFACELFSRPLESSQVAGCGVRPATCVRRTKEVSPMSKWALVLLFVAGAALAWGNYVPLVHVAAQQLKSNLRAFLLVGVAYFLVAVAVPAIMIFVLKYDPTQKG